MRPLVLSRFLQKVQIYNENHVKEKVYFIEKFLDPDTVMLCLRFTDPYERGQSRYVVTTSMHIGPSYALQFDLVMGCSEHFSPNLDNHLQLEFSTNHGMTWQLVRSGCIPPAMCEEYHEATVYEAAQFMTWTRVTHLLPPNTWYASRLP